MNQRSSKEKEAIFSTNSEFEVQLFDNDSELSPDEFGEAEASIAKSSAVSWAKFVLTDDRPNGNKQRIPESEFDNLIKTGIFMPIKMTKIGKKIHETSEPLGVITNLKKSGNKIIGLAALWKKEREEDIKLLKEEAAQKKINLSWEVLYEDSKPSSEFDGVQDLYETSLKAATIVDEPAYKGRTPILAVAAMWSTAYLKELPDTSFLIVNDTDGTKERLYPYKDKDEKIDINQLNIAMASLDSSELPETVIKKTKKVISKLIKEANSSVLENQSMEENKLEELDIFKSRVDELNKVLDETKAKLATAEEAVKAKDGELVKAQESLKELDGLKKYKADSEAEKALTEKWDAIKQKFADAKIEKDETYFDEHKESLLGLDEKALDFMLQELVAFGTNEQETAKQKAESASLRVPSLKGNASAQTNVSELASELRRVESERRAKK